MRSTAAQHLCRQQPTHGDPTCESESKIAPRITGPSKIIMAFLGPTRSASGPATSAPGMPPRDTSVNVSEPVCVWKGNGVTDLTPAIDERGIYQANVLP